MIFVKYTLHLQEIEGSLGYSIRFSLFIFDVY